MIEAVTNAEGIDVLEHLAQFAGARHRLIVHNIANLDTPGFRPLDVSVADFREALGEAIDRRRATGRPGDPLGAFAGRTVELADGAVRLQPEPVGANLLFHDGNDRDLERTMQDLVENFLTFRVASELMRSRFDLINTAIRERI